ncbi:hypothetical protein C8Q73DRAFT_449053 [Cubamyces lactineus]|nr:hypothetical protein C8Q73DRAFT_449053 [Cubamyces lactineus]
MRMALPPSAKETRIVARIDNQLQVIADNVRRRAPPIPIQQDSARSHRYHVVCADEWRWRGNRTPRHADASQAASVTAQGFISGEHPNRRERPKGHHGHLPIQVRFRVADLGRQDRRTLRGRGLGDRRWLERRQRRLSALGKARHGRRSCVRAVRALRLHWKFDRTHATATGQAPSLSHAKVMVVEFALATVSTLITYDPVSSLLYTLR